ncbi:MAG: hypothetical protein AB1333_04435 [Patescibacteria group bacterium]
MNEQQLTPNPNIRLVVNGGSTVLDSATIPVEWHLSDELISKNPQYVVICDHENTLDYFKERRGLSCGNRYFCKVTDLVKYLQLFTSGKHHLVIMVFYGCDAEAEAQKYLRRNKDSAGWRETVWYTDVEGKSSYGKETTVFEFEVPKELFAQKPETGFSALIWKWTNGWYSEKPIDECEYRKRKIFAFTIKPPLFLLFYSVVFVIGMLYMILTAKIVYSIIYNIINNPPSVSLPHSSVFVWIVIVIATFTILFLGAKAWVTYYFSPEKKRERSMKKREKERKQEDKKELKEEKKAQLERQKEEEVKERVATFLKTNASFNSVSAKVDIQRVIPVVDRTTRFTIRFWNLKAKVCKPFARY